MSTMEVFPEGSNVIPLRKETKSIVEVNPEKIKIARDFFREKGIAAEAVWENTVGHGDILRDARQRLNVDSEQFELIMDAIVEERRQSKRNYLAKNRREN